MGEYVEERENNIKEEGSLEIRGVKGGIELEKWDRQRRRKR